MEFKFKRKYTNFSIIAIMLHLLILVFWLFFPTAHIFTPNGKKIATLLAVINCELILLFYLGLFKKKYYAYYDKLTIKRSLLKTLTIKYDRITTLKEKSNDSILFGFGERPSFVIYYKSAKNRNKKCTVRSDNNKLLLKVIKNEIDIAKIK